VLLARYLEHIIPFLRQDGGVIAAHRHLMQEIIWEHFLAVQIWLVVLFFFYSVLFELVRVLGKKRVIKLFFGLE
jgi:type VI protein secretion system component VasF